MKKNKTRVVSTEKVNKRNKELNKMSKSIGFKNYSNLLTSMLHDYRENNLKNWFSLTLKGLKNER